MGIFDRKKADNHANNASVSDGESLKTKVMHSEPDDHVFDDELPSVNRRQSSNRLVDMLGFGVLLGAGLGMLYFVNADTEEEKEVPKKQEVVNRLPPLEMPAPPPPEQPMVLEPAPPPQPVALKPSNKSQGGQPVKTWADRKMEGPLVIQGGGTGGEPKAQTAQNVQQTAQKDNADTSPLGLKLKPTISAGVSASMLPNRDYLITKGASLDCALETAIDSTLPGLTTCRLTRDVYSDNGHVVLLDRGSQLVGEYQSGVTAGQARLFVLWTRAKTPNGVIINLDSPGADTLGRSGHSGWVDTHFFQRFGAAIMMSIVKDSLAYARTQQEGSPVVITGGNSDQLATEILKNTVNIPPTLYINQGEHLQIMVGRDLDFSTVYDLKLKE